MFVIFDLRMSLFFKELPTPKCQEGWLEKNNICYKKLMRANYWDAKSQCAEAGGSRLVENSVDAETLEQLG